MERLCFSPLVQVTPADAGGLRLSTPWTAITLARPTAGHRAVVDLLAAEGADEQTLQATMAAADGAINVLTFGALVARCEAQGLLTRRFSDASGPLLRFVPRGPRPPVTAAPSGCLQLSRFAYLRQVEGALMVTSPRVAVDVWLETPIMASVVAFFAQPRVQADAPPVLEASVAAAVRHRLAAWGVLVEAGSEDGPGADPALRQWEFHDLLFHAASRVQPGRPVGATFRFRDDLAPSPFVKPPMSTDVVRFERPDLRAAIATDPPLVSAVETRRSRYHHGDTPVTVSQLGELLYRSARVRAMRDTPAGELGSKPYPSGGAIYELEIYLAVHRCEGLASGFYHYDPLAHHLERLHPRDGLVEAMLREVAWALPNQAWPQVRLMFAARMSRLAWKYEGVAYALALKHVGVLTQTLYLNATALGLAPLAIGGASTSWLSQATGIPDHVEAQVGEFVIGSSGPEPEAPWGEVAFRFGRSGPAAAEN